MKTKIIALLILSFFVMSCNTKDPKKEAELAKQREIEVLRQDSIKQKEAIAKLNPICLVAPTDTIQIKNLKMVFKKVEILAKKRKNNELKVYFTVTNHGDEDAELPYIELKETVQEEKEIKTSLDRNTAGVAATRMKYGGRLIIDKASQTHLNYIVAPKQTVDLAYYAIGTIMPQYIYLWYEDETDNINVIRTRKGLNNYIETYGVTLMPENQKIKVEISSLF